MIKLLDQATINQIAAGEVIERPVNIVKELVENSIDANANRISIEIENGGIDRIIIKDNGDGFDKEDLLFAFVPHATSKIEKIDDLNSIFTYGFRGEALASIALVSKVTLISKQRTSKYAYQIISDNGNITDIIETTAQDGTKIIVEDLFKKIPARRKFLKSASIEATKIYDIVEKIALSREEISFKFVSDKRERFTTAGNNRINNIIYTLYGRDISDNIIDIDKTINGIHISGVIGKPLISKNNRNEEIFFVNGRYIKNDILYKAVEEAYREYLMQHKYPFIVLNINLDGNLIDVNAHPQKIEIRFSNSIDLYSIVKSIISEALKNSILIVTPNHYETDDKVAMNHYESSYNSSVNYHKKDVVEGTKHCEPVSININSLKSLKELEELTINHNHPSMHKSTQKSLYEYFNNTNEEINDLIDDVLKNEDSTRSDVISNNYDNISMKRSYTYIGQIFNTYLIFELRDKVVFVDQHAAHEKINYEKFIDLINNNTVKTQKIMPIVITLNAFQYNCIKDNIADFRNIGYDIEFFGDKDIIVEGVPLNLIELVDKSFLLEMIDNFSKDNDFSQYDSIKDKIATMSCKASIKANQIVNDKEAYNLIEQLFKLKNPYNCPHGRPTMIEFTKVEFDKRFKRIVN